MLSNHTIKESKALDDRLASLVGMAQNYKADGYSDVQAMEAALGAYERSTGRNIGYGTLEQLYQALEARGFSFPEEELEEATTRRGTKMKESAELTTDQLNSYAAREGLSDMRFLKTKRIGYRDDGTKDVYLTLSLDNEEEYIVGEMLFYFSSSGDPVLRFPPPLFVTTDRIEAIDEFNNYSTSRSQESRRAGGKHALAQKYRMNKNTTEKISTRESSEKITWSSFDTPESNALEEKYLPANGDGDNMASQAVTATTRLIYKWFNNGDVYDNSYGLSGWANDISGSANWLAKHVPGARDILWRIQKTHSEEEYVSNILWPLFNLVYDPKLLSSLEKKPKVDDAYSCKGPFEFNYVYEDEDAYQEDPESFGDYDQDYELDESAGKKAKLARSEAASEPADHPRTRESTGGKYKLEYVLYSRGDVYRKVGSFSAPSDQEACKKAAMIQANYGPLKDLDAEARAELEEDVMRDFEEYSEQHSDPIEAWDSFITYNSEEFSVRLTAPDGRVLIDTGMDDFAEEEDFEDIPEPGTPEARYAHDHPGISKLWSMPAEYLADEKDLKESKKTSIDELLREAAMPFGRDRLGDWYNHSFRERNGVASKSKMKESSGANGVRESHDRLPYGDGLHWNSQAADDMLLAVLREIYENANIELPVTTFIRALIPAELKKSIKFLDRILLDLYV